MIRGHLKWLWLLPVVMVPILVRYYFVWQLLSAEVLFALHLVIAAGLLALLLAVLIAVGYSSERSIMALVSIGRHLRSSAHVS
jgi:hypothetical protein